MLVKVCSQMSYLRAMKTIHLSLGSLLVAGIIAAVTTAAHGESNLLSSEKTFFCQTNNKISSTLAKTSDGEILPIFNWKQEALPSETDLQQTCNDVSQKLENYFVSHGDLSSLTFKPTQLENLPVICLAGENNECNFLLLALGPNEKPLNTANELLESILNPQLQANKKMSYERGVQSIYYSVDLWQLLGLKFSK